jgi:hypothetical protein
MSHTKVGWKSKKPDESIKREAMALALEATRERGGNSGRFGCGILIHETTYAPGGGMERNKGGGNTHPPATLKQQGRNAKRGNGDAAGFSLSSNHSTQPHD